MLPVVENAWPCSPIDVDQVLALEDVDDLQVLRGGGVGVGDAVVVEHQLGVGEVLLGQPEGVEDPVPARAVGAVGAAQRAGVVAARVAVVALVGGVGAVRRVVQRLVDDLQPLDLRVALGHGREPLLDLHELLLGGQRGHPRRLLVAPDEHVEVELHAVGLREVVRRVQIAPAHGRGAGRARGTPPLARVLRRDLIEVLREQRPGQFVDIPEPFVLPVDREASARSARAAVDEHANAAPTASAHAMRIPGHVPLPQKLDDHPNPLINGTFCLTNRQSVWGGERCTDPGGDGRWRSPAPCWR